MVMSRLSGSLMAGVAAATVLGVLVTVAPVGAQSPAARSQPVTVTNTPLPVAPAVSFDGFRDGFAIGEGGSSFVEFDPLYVSLIVVTGSEDDIVELSFFSQSFSDGNSARFTLEGASHVIPLGQPLALDAVGVRCRSGSGECNLDVSLLGTAAG